MDLGVFYEEAASSDATLLVSSRKTKRYLLFDGQLTLKGWTNIETGEVRSPIAHLDTNGLAQLAFSGIHAISPSLFPRFSEMPERFGIIDFYLKFCNLYQFKGCWKKDLRLMDVGKLETLEQAEQFLLSI